jgi:hypothetical protein
LALLESIIEINIFAVRDTGPTKKQIHSPKNSIAMRLAAVQAGELLCLSALYAADDNGAIAEALSSDALRNLGRFNTRCERFSKRQMKYVS